MLTDRQLIKMSKSSNDQKVYRTTIIVLILIFTYTYVMFATESEIKSPGVIRGTTPNEQTDCRTTLCQQQSVKFEVARKLHVALDKKRLVRAFISELQEATKRAAGGEDEKAWFNRDKWNRENPCLSRTEMPQKYTRRKYVRDLEPNPQWQAVLKEYAKLHRTCMHRIGDPTAYYMSRNTSIDCKFAVVDTGRVGIGNRLLVFASGLAYAVLTKRVLLVAGGTQVLESGWLCEPFEGSSWGNFDPARTATPFHKENQFWNKSGSFLGRIDKARRLGNSSAALPLVMDYAVANDLQPDSRFYCDTEQEYYKNVTWVYFNSCFNFLPKFFAVPSFRPILDALFPDRMALTRILRDVMTPADPVWVRVKNIDRGYLKQADRRLGVQLRYRGGGGEYNKIHDAIAARVLECAIDNSILPGPVQDSIPDTRTAPTTPPLRNPRNISVFMASLYEGVRSNLTETFLRYPTATGDGVQVVQFSHEGSQKFGVKVFQDAMADILILSFSDYLFVTPLSTFSGIAQAYGGLVPWFIDWRQNITFSGPCTRAQTVDVCFQIPFDYNIKCPYDPTRHDKVISDVFPDIQKCLDVDTAGLQLITKNDLSMEEG